MSTIQFSTPSQSSLLNYSHTSSSRYFLPAISSRGHFPSSPNSTEHTKSKLVLSKELLCPITIPKAPESVANSSKSKIMADMSVSQKLTLGYAAFVGLGGVMGYVKSGSVKSIAAGGLSASVLYYVYTELPIRPTFAASVGLGVSAALTGAMVFRFKKTGKMFPAGVVSLVSLAMAGGYLHGILRTMH